MNCEAAELSGTEPEASSKPQQVGAKVCAMGDWGSSQKNFQNMARKTAIPWLLEVYSREKNTDRSKSFLQYCGSVISNMNNIK